METIAVIVLLGLLAVGILAGCAKSADVPMPPPAPPKIRPGILFGYFGGSRETFDHVSIVFATDWFGVDAQIQQIIEAARDGFPVMLHCDALKEERNFRDRLTQIKAAGALSAITHIYYDEPDRVGMSPAQVQATNEMLRRVSAEFGITPRLATFYTDANTWEGVEFFDDVGYDNYGINVVTHYPRLKAVVKPGQGIMLVAGGADPWRNDPQVFLDLAASDPAVTMILVFAWTGGSESGYATGWGEGVRTNGMAAVYREMALRLK